ncbi:MAG: hypothetical protein J4G18_07755 [Anaerolineae bacterium]|nr:hypothetical protein [Anaerolineae bacterium]
MEAFVLVLSAVSIALLLRIRGVNERLKREQNNVATSAKQKDALEAQLEAATNQINAEAQNRAELEEELKGAREYAVLTSQNISALEAQVQVAQQDTQVGVKNNAELVSQLKAARREIRQLRKVIAERDEEERLSHVIHGELAENNSRLKRQLKDAQYALSKETKFRTSVTTERRQYRRRFESESLKRSEIEDQLHKTLHEVQRLSKDLRKLKAIQAKHGKT